MIFGGFQSISFSDFPGCAASLLFTQGCNFRCPFCHNGALLPAIAPGCFDENTAAAMIAARKKMIDGIVITGGEPTLHPDLNSFIREIKTPGLQIKLDTNGSRPDALEQLLSDNLLDYVAMDVKAPWAAYHRLTGVACDTRKIQRSVNLIAGASIRAEFRTTVVPDLLTSGDLDQIRWSLPDDVLYKTQTFIAENALAPELRINPAA